MPHIGDTRYAVVSCHVERPLHDETWRRFSALQARAPGGFRIAALLRPPDRASGEDEDRWVERARQAAKQGPLGHHTHWGGPERARPARGVNAAARVGEEAAWLRHRGFEPRLFCGGGWYTDAEVAATLAELGCVDCTATAFRPAYLPPDATRAELDVPAWVRLGERRLLVLPTTHSLGMAARAAIGPSSTAAVVHAYFHDTDLTDVKRRLALGAALVVLGRRRRAIDLEQLAAAVADTAPEVAFGEVARPGNRRPQP